MEDLGLVVLTGVIILAFSALFYGTFLEFNKMTKDEYTGTERTGDTNSFSAFLNKLFN